MNRRLRFCWIVTTLPDLSFYHTNDQDMFLQMTLWSMAKSPLMFGGDMKKLDDATLAIISNPTVLEINSFSTNNKEAREIQDLIHGLTKLWLVIFETVRLTCCMLSQQFVPNFVLRNRGNKRRQQSKKDWEHIGGLENAPAWGLTTCGDSNVKGWTTKVNDGHPDKICWKDGDFCLHLSNSSMSA